VTTTATGVACSPDALATTAEDVTVASTLGNTGVLTSTSAVTGGGTVSLTLADADPNTDATSVQTVQRRS
jgi:hypothetical protein